MYIMVVLPYQYANGLRIYPLHDFWHLWLDTKLDLRICTELAYQFMLKIDPKISLIFLLVLFMVHDVCTNCVSLSGLSLKSQDLTALFLAVRLYCSFVMEYDIHTILDTAALAATLFVIYMIRFKLRSTYMLDKDNFALYYVVSTIFISWLQSNVHLESLYCLLLCTV